MHDINALGPLTVVLFLALLLAALLVGVSVIGLLVDRVSGRAAPPRAVGSVSERLARLDELLVEEEITLEEHAQARMAILTGG